MASRLDEVRIEDEAPTSRRSSWLLLSILGLVAAIAAMFAPTIRMLHALWLDGGLQTYTHGYLIVAICVWLLFRDRERLARTDMRPSPWAAVVVAVASILWLIVYRAGIQTAEQILYAVVVIMAAVTALGRRAFATVAIAFGYFFFAVRIWDLAIGPLQWATTTAVQFLLQLTGVSAFVDGNFVHLAAGTFEIADGCSGLHFLIVGLALAVLYGEMNRDSLRTRLLLVGLAVVLALLTNWLRVYVIIVAGYLTDMQHYLVRVEHYRFGWVVFAVSMAMFFWIAHRIPAAQDLLPRTVTNSRAGSTRRQLLAGVLLAACAAAVGPIWNMLSPVRPAQANGAPRTEGANETQWKIEFAGADDIRIGAVTAGATRVEYAIATYLYQGEGKELLGYSNTLAPPPLRVVSQARRDTSWPLIESLVEDGQNRWVMWHFYEVAGVPLNRAWATQLAYGLQSLMGAPLLRVVAVRAVCNTTCDAARAALPEALRSMKHD